MLNPKFITDMASDMAKELGLSGVDADDFVKIAELKYKEAGRELLHAAWRLRQKAAA